ncbi:MAG: hypothetical protein WCI90_10155 [Chlorobium sp.]
MESLYWKKGTLSDVFRLNKPPIRLTDKELLPFTRLNPDCPLTKNRDISTEDGNGVYA